MKRRFVFVFFVVLVNIVFIAISWAQSEQPASPVPALFTDAGGRFDAEPLPAITQRVDVRQTRRIAVNLEALRSSPERIALDLPASGKRIAVLDQVEPHALIPGGFSWVGHIEDDPFSLVVLTVGGGQLSAEITPFGEKYHIYSTGQGHVLAQSDIHLPHAAGQTDALPVALPDMIDLPLDALPAARLDGSPVQIDVMSLYTPNARAEAGGTTQMQNIIQGAFAGANRILANSDLNVTFNLVHAAEVSYTSSGSSTTDLQRLMGTSDGFIDNIHTLRNTYNADLVHLVMEEYAPADPGGLAYLMGSPGIYFESYAFFVLELSRYGAYGIAHEHGHNLGSNHNREEYTNFTSGAFPYSYAFRSLGGFATAVSYQTGCTIALPCPLIPYYSQPNRIFNGTAMGAQNANNALSVSQTAATVAGFRPLPALPTLTNLLVGTDFSRFDFPWFSGSVNLSTTASVLSTTTTAANGIIGQTVTNRQLASGTKFLFTFDIANPSATARSIFLVLTDTDSATSGSNYQVFCSFSIAGSTPLRKYALRAALPVAWTGLQAYAQIVPSGVTLQFASPELQINPALVAGCPGNGAPSTIPPTPTPIPTGTPFVETLPVNTNLIIEPDFEPFVSGIWYASNLTQSVSTGVLTATTTAAGSIYQQVTQLNIASGSKFTLTLSMANNNNFENTIGLSIYTSGGSETCWFTLPPNSSLQTYTARYIVPSQWASLNFQAYILDGGATIRFANPDLRYTPSASFAAKECVAPVGPTATPTPTNTPTQAVASILAAVTFQGRPSPPHSLLIQPLRVTITPTAGGAAVFDNTVTTSNLGVFTVMSIPPGSYRIRVKGSHTLSVVVSATLTAGSNTLTMGTLKEGDANDDNTVSLSDFSLLASSFGKSTGDPGFDARTDFNGDGQVVLSDFSLLASNYGQSGQN